MAHVPFVDRAAEVAAIGDAGRAAAQGAGRIVTVGGPPGIGKTALVRHATVGACGTVWATSGARRAGSRWATLRGLVRAAGSRAGFPPELAAAAGADVVDRPVTFDELGAEFVAWGLCRTTAENRRRGALTILVDDADAIDACSAAVLALAIRDAEPVLWVLVARDVRQAVARLEVECDDERRVDVAMAGLDDVAVAELVRARVGVRWSAGDARRLTVLTGGSPQRVLDWADRLGATPDLERLHRNPALFDPDPLTGVDLDDRSTTVLAAVVLAGSVPVSGLGAITGDADATVDDALAAGEAAGIVEVVDGVARCVDPLAGAAVVRSLGGVRTARLHARIAAVTDDEERRAWHLGEATLRPDANAAAALDAAATSARAAGDADVAARRWARSAALTHPADHIARRRRLAAAGDAAADAGDWRRGVDLLRAALDLGDGEDLLELTISLAVCIERLQGVGAVPQTDLERCVERLAADPLAQSAALRAMARLAQFRDLPQAAAYARRAVDAAAAGLDAAALDAARLCLANIDFMRGEPVALDEPLRRVRTRAAPPVGQGAAWFLGELLVWSDRHDDARRLLTDMLAHGRTEGRVTSAAQALDQLAAVEFRAGNWDESVRWRRELRALHGAFGQREDQDESTEALVLAAARGQDNDARRIVAFLDASDADATPLLVLHRHVCVGFAHLAAGRWHEARAELVAARSLAADVGLADDRCIEFRADLVEALVHLGHVDDAASVGEELSALAARVDSPAIGGHDWRCRGLVADAAGDHRVAVDALARAVQLHDRADRPFLLARTLLAYGAALRRDRARSAARDALLRARTIAEGIGAVPWIERADTELARLGVRTIGSRDATALTATEARIVDLVVEGRTNADIASTLFVSVRTVESNLTRAYRKLGVRSRTELIARAAGTRTNRSAAPPASGGRAAPVA